MRIITVSPLSKGIKKDTLTYFTKEEITNGSIVKIPVRSKTIFGLVVESKAVSEMKSEIKSLSYSIRRIEKVPQKEFLDQNFIEASREIADYYATQLGNVLSTLVPHTILESVADLPESKNITDLENSFYETSLIQADDEARFVTYKSLIREEFARGHSVLFILPTTEHIQTAEEKLHRGITEYTYTMHSGIAKKELVSRWKKIIEETHPVLVIATGQFLCLPRNDIQTIILEKESSRSYATQSRPFIDLRVVAKLIAKKTRRRLILGDTLLRIETIWEGKHAGTSELSALKFHSLSGAQSELLDMTEGRKAEDKKEGQTRFSLWSKELLSLLEDSREKNEKTVLFCGRKGLQPITLCNDCGNIVGCNNCNAPVVLYSKTVQGVQKNLFVCHHCGERRDADILCKHCRSWKLSSYGVGIDQVEKELAHMFPDTKVIVIDSEHIKTHKQAVSARDTFYATPGSILLGTEMCLPYLNEPVENSAVVSMDSFFSIPDFRINEKIFTILLTLRNNSEKRMLVQTRKPEQKIFDYALKGNLLDFYNEEIDERKIIGYPPFVTYIKLSLSGEKVKVKAEMEKIKETLKPFSVSLFDAFNPGSQKNYTLHGLISLPQGSWVNKDLLHKLRQLPHECSVKIDPDTLL